MLRATAFTLLLFGVLSHPLALLCLDDCTMKMGSGDSAGTPTSPIIQADMRECCLGSAQVTKQWRAKPLPKGKQLGGAPELSPGLFTAAFSHALLPAPPVEQRGSPPTGASVQILRV
jgi:hypothetical protein